MSALSAALEQALVIVKRDQRRGRGINRWRAPSGQRILQIREALNLSQEEFCKRYGLDLITYQAWEEGRTTTEQNEQLYTTIVNGNQAAAK